MSETIKYISDASFDADVTHSSTPVLVDYWAEWCGPCKMIAPILEEVSKDYAGKLQIAKMMWMKIGTFLQNLGFAVFQH